MFAPGGFLPSVGEQYEKQCLAAAASSVIEKEPCLSDSHKKKQGHPEQIQEQHSEELRFTQAGTNKRWAHLLAEQKSFPKVTTASEDCANTTRVQSSKNI